MATLHKDLFHILLQYYALIPPRAMSFPPHLSFDDIHDFLISVLLGYNWTHLKAYPPSEVYQYTFWKMAIQFLEEMSTNEACVVD